MIGAEEGRGQFNSCRPTPSTLVTGKAGDVKAIKAVRRVIH